MKTKIKVKTIDGENGITHIPTEEPMASQWHNCRGLAKASGAVYHGVKFGRSNQSRLGYLSWQLGLGTERHDEAMTIIRALVANGGGEVEVEQSDLDKLAAMSAEIDRIAAIAVPARPAFRCASAKDGCAEMVDVKGGYCRSCAFDEFDN